VGDISDRRAQKKAQTREQIRTVAHRLFAQGGFDGVTIADVAREADVAVQTVFNHFATKEELFFDGRTPWVDGPAAAVRTREPSVQPLVALRGYLVETVGSLVASHTVAERSRYLATLEASESLRVHERELVHAAELRLRDALFEAWDRETDVPGTPVDPATAAPLVAAVWLAAARTIVLEQRPGLADGARPDRTAVDVRELADRVLRQLEAGVAVVHGGVAPASGIDTGWPRHTIRRAC
jgi:AcrR family transcriptional regulator